LTDGQLIFASKWPQLAQKNTTNISGTNPMKNGKLVNNTVTAGSS
jgi:hypothetical protein